MGGAAAVCFASDAASQVLRAEEIAARNHGDDMAAAEDYWAEIRRAFDSDRTLINLNHGGVAPASSVALEAMIRDLRFSNVAPAHHMWDVLEPRVESVRRNWHGSLAATRKSWPSPATPRSLCRR